MVDAEARKIADQLTPQRRAAILRLSAGPLTIREACPTKNCLPSLLDLVRWSGEYRPGGTDATFELTYLGRRVAAALRGRETP
jgi:hypothetical protein